MAKKLQEHELEKSYFLKSLRDTQCLAETLASQLTVPMVITLSGEIGSGKTTFVRALLKTLGVKEAVKSPTFTLVETYVVGDYLFHHFDLYRISDPEELAYIGMADYFTQNAICCIEWPERLGREMLVADVALFFELCSQGRVVRLCKKNASLSSDGFASK